MTWLPSFVKLFLLFVFGTVLLFVSNIISMEYFNNYTLSSIFTVLRLVGLVIMLVAPLLIALKFFAQLDRKNA